MQVNSEPTTRETPTRPAPSAPPQPKGRGKSRAAVVRHQLSAGDAEKAAALRKMKLVALGLLVVMAVIFVFAFALQKEYPWLEYVRAAAEGGMVGALADWFAVTALFKYPMGIKIPHTAIIPRRKDQIGASLGEFVETNFLSEQVVQEKLASVNIARRAGEWLATPAGADRVAKEGAAVIRGLFKVLNDDDVQAVIEGMVRKHLLAPPWGPPVGKMAERIFHDGHHHKLVDLLVDRAADWVDDNHETVTRLVSDRSPTWVPQFVDGLVGDKVYVEILKFVRAVQADQNHQVRQSIDKYLNDLAQDLQHDPAMIARAEDIKAQVLGDPEVRELASRTWGTVKNALLGAVDDPDSELTIKFKAAVRDFGSRLVSEPELAGKVNTWIGDAASYLVRTYRSDIAGVITDTVARWDAEETSQKIELQVGKDLQFIRINGTVVGSLAGLAIFTVAHLIFG
ncbi:DUF445 domain-containing protein [Pseudarthrobacter phenanthrenivorans]|jgi:uncharacterized membrane-anchored protein YjiN (DUF445 family)|uniref:Putative membrane protein n=1 Tax=Pseudarthrobacter phenanthrenivorans (strain DSM 18606 / JCM 16027 / LMG 23796 / Sphe3) TaxID=930171 RepID=F0M9H7_PSEPM|nr:DUF445 family protein [Pseudarthrobacter phenanthrenivorans]ADX71654.1 putative membrane protein [Pseudarthrobacter phenanthrenivorans Sphe3]TPV48855.1 DUF445 domain-containing protein [Pseudarthrobacter phenanthrenivorans]